MRIVFILLLLSLTSAAQADNVRIKRVCLDEIKDSIFIRYGFQFDGADCPGAEVVIYGSKDGGSFNLVGKSNVTESFIGVRAGNSKNWQFFIRLLNTCDGDSVTGTDTITPDLLPPVGMQLDSVSLLNNDTVIIGWTGATSSDLRGYVVYYDDEESGLGVTLDSVHRDSTYYLEVVDSVKPDAKAITYTFAAFDSCSLSSGQLERHTTIHLNLGEVDFCKKTAAFSKTEYKGWDNSSVVYTLVYKRAGDKIWRTFQYFNQDELDVDLESLDGILFFKVRATDIGTGFTSSSNYHILDFRKERTLDSFYVYSVNNLGDLVEVRWWSGEPGLVKKYGLLTELNGVVTDIRSIGNSGNGRINTVMVNRVATGRKYFLEAYSRCNENLGISNKGEVIGLNMTSGEGLTQKAFNTELHFNGRELQWNAYTDWVNGVDYYLVERKLNSGWEELARVTDTVYLDGEVIELDLDSGICYRVTAVENDPYLDIVGTSRSNDVCFSFDFHGDIPNAFVADEKGVSVFNIEVEGLDTANSYMNVFNRWGQEVYSDGLEWNGYVGNELAKPCPVDVYFFTARIQLKNNQFYYVSGKIHLIK